MSLFRRKDDDDQADSMPEEDEVFQWPPEQAEPVAGFDEEEPDDGPEPDIEEPEIGEPEAEPETEEYEIFEYGSEEPIETLKVVPEATFHGEQEVATPQAEEESVGLYGKFTVERNDGKDRPGGPKDGARYFVLDYVNDPVARVALRAYVNELRRQKIEPELIEDLNREISATFRSR